MSAIVKPKLKAAREALNKKDFAKVKDLSLSVLEYEPENFLAHVFLGIAYLELGDIQQSEQMYLKATSLQPDQINGWQGLTQLYLKSESWDKYVENLQRVAQLLLKSNDAVKCAETVEKIIACRKQHGTPLQSIDSLSLLLPESPYYTLLSNLPPPDATNPDASTTFFTQSAIHNSLPIYEQIIEVVEKQEEDTFTKEVAKRRTRLGAGGPEAVKREVGREVWGSSRLPALYTEVMSHPHASDELRRSTEAKLLRHKQQLLYALQPTGDSTALKAKLSQEVQELVRGIVLLNIPNELAWSLFIEGTDAVSIEGYDLDVLFRFVQLFPTTPLAKLLSAYFLYAQISEVDSDENDNDNTTEDGGDYAAVIMDLFPDTPESILAHRIAAEVYLNEDDLENAVKTAENGIELVAIGEQQRAIGLPQVRRGLYVILGTALVHLFPPKHHIRALRIINEVLTEDEDNVACLMGRGYILQYSKRWDEARTLFNKVVRLLPDDLHDGLRSREESAWCQGQSQDPDGGARELQGVAAILDGQDGRELDQARCWWRLGKCQWELGDTDSRESAYSSFITALKRYPTFAPAFTSLGIYYSEFLSPPDPPRASKCFQKAFELDSREAEAARRLAEGFAEEREWDLVEVVSRRTIEGEGGLEGGLDSISASRFQPLNSWAWKALGVVELTRHRYAAAISAFQVALRSEPEDALIWLRLGEAYSRSSRLAAALKALEKARELDPTDWRCSYYLGDVYRQSGQYQQAIDTFSKILSEVPSELTVLLALAQTHLDFGRANKAAGFSHRAEASFVTAIRIILDGLDASPGFRRIAWKIAADALYSLSLCSSYVDPEVLVSVLQQALPLITAHPAEPLSAVMDIPPLLPESSDAALSRFILEVTVCAYSYRLSLGSLDSSAGASASYDLGVALRLYAHHTADESKRAKINDEAIHHLKEAVSSSPLEAAYWNALATAFFETRPRLAQHAYVKALELDNKNFAIWTNLGLFCAYHGDIPLAKEAFKKAQVLDPDYALAWIGQAVIAVAGGQDAEASALFEHAVGLTVTVPEADLAFGKRSLDAFNKASATQPAVESIFPAFFVLDRYVKQRPQDATALHLFGLVCERIGHLDLGIAAIGEAVSRLEAAYEESEDTAIERQFTIAHINMARLRLSAAAYDEALESYQVAIGLLAESADESSTALLAQAHLGSGIAHYYLRNTQDALMSFESAASHGDVRMKGHAIVLLAQTLWSLDTEEGQEAAKAQLLQSIDVDSDNLMAINTLAGMGILTDDDSLLDAALSEILALPVDDRQQRDPGRDVTYLLTHHHLAQDNAEQALAVAQKAILYEPSRWKSREDLASLALQQGEPTVARALLRPSGAHTELRQTLGLQAVAEAGAKVGSATAHAAKAVFLTPWDRRNWQALAYCCSVSGPTRP